MNEIVAFMSTHPDIMSGVGVVLIAGLGILGKKYAKFKKYSDVLANNLQDELVKIATSRGRVPHLDLSA